MTIRASSENGTNEEEKADTLEKGAATGEDAGGGAHLVISAVLIFVPERTWSLGQRRDPCNQFTCVKMGMFSKHIYNIYVNL